MLHAARSKCHLIASNEHVGMSYTSHSYLTSSVPFRRCPYECLWLHCVQLRLCNSFPLSFRRFFHISSGCACKTSDGRDAVDVYFVILVWLVYDTLHLIKSAFRRICVFEMEFINSWLSQCNDNNDLATMSWVCTRDDIAARRTAYSLSHWMAPPISVTHLWNTAHVDCGDTNYRLNILPSELINSLIRWIETNSRRRRKRVWTSDGEVERARGAGEWFGCDISFEQLNQEAMVWPCQSLLDENMQCAGPYVCRRHTKCNRLQSRA